MNAFRKRRILKRIQKHELTAIEGYKLLYENETNPANYIKMRLKINDEPRISKLVNTIFYFPIGIRFATNIILHSNVCKKYVNKDEYNDNDIKEIVKLFTKYGGNTSIAVDTEDVKVRIKLY